MRRWLRRVAGDEAVDPAVAPTARRDDPAALRDALDALVSLINANAGQMPTRALVDARRLTDTLAEIVDTTSTRPLDTYAVISLRSTMDDYLPTTLRRYLALDHTQRIDTSATDQSANDALLQQIEVLQQSVTASLLAVRQQDAQALMIQGSFLETRFSGSDLDI
ncbi:hypothetical protein V3N99_02485 [Dermatophilaceae bacterium Soc4.6]